MINNFSKKIIILLIILVAIFSIYSFRHELFHNDKKVMIHNDKKIIAALDKETTQQSLTIQGKIPEWLNGTFVRNGPVPVRIDGQKVAHWFDGPAMLHAFSFDNGKVLYSNKFLKTDAYKKIFLEGKLDYAGFATESTNETFWEKVKTFFIPSKDIPIQNAVVNVGRIANQTVAVTETPLPVKFDLKTLDTLGALQYQDNLPQKDIFESVHPQTDNHTNEKFNYLVEYGRNSYYAIYRLNNDKPIREVIAKIQVEKPAYMHSFAMTEHYIILVEFPLLVNPIDLITSNSFIKNFKWYPENGTNFIIVDKKTGQTVKTIHDKTPIFAFHHANAYEKDNNIIIDLVTYPDASVVTKISTHGDMNEPYNEKKTENQTFNQTKLMRYTISPKTDSIQSQIILEALEFPRINENYNGYPYRYLYAADTRPLIENKDLRPLYKINTESKETVLWQEAGALPGEPIFVANPNSNNEDEGVILSIILNEPNQKAYLLILDAKSFKEMGRIYTPHLIPIGLHAQFFN